MTLLNDQTKLYERIVRISRTLYGSPYEDIIHDVYLEFHEEADTVTDEEITESYQKIARFTFRESLEKFHTTLPMSEIEEIYFDNFPAHLYEIPEIDLTPEADYGIMDALAKTGTFNTLRELLDIPENSR